MLEIITKNPFRILGVYSNSKQSDIVRNVGKLKAFLNVGKEVDYPSDMAGILPEINRTLDNTQGAQSAINLPKDKIRYALFWFCCVDALDNTGLNNLSAKDTEKALSIFCRKETFSSLINRAVLYLILSDYSSAVTAYSTVLHDYTYREQFIATICGETFTITEKELSEILIDELLTEVKPIELLQLFNNELDKDYIRQKAIQGPLATINSEIEKAKRVSPSDAAASFNAGKTLISKTRNALSTLKTLLGTGNIQYQTAADNLAKTILQSGINYYNNTDDEDDIDNALTIQEYALKIAVGKITKDRCQENVNILKEKKQQSAYSKDLDAIATELKAFHAGSPSIARARALVTSCKPHLTIIKSHLGSGDDFYLKVSTAVANNALGMIIDVVNREQNKITSSNSYGSTYYSPLYQDRKTLILNLWHTIDSAVNAMELIRPLDMTLQERNHFNSNMTTLSSLQSQLSSAAKSYTSPPRTTYTSSSSSSGCYIATMVYGDYDEPQVMILRDFRDTVLNKSTLGRLFVRFYYRYSPTWVEHLKDKKRINLFIRTILDKFITIYRHEKD